MDPAATTSAAPSSAASPAEQERLDRLQALRIKHAQTRLARLKVQRTRWRLSKLRDKWLSMLQGVQFERSLIQEQHNSVSTQAGLTTRQLEALSQMNAANDCFYIWHAGPFATINGFRLGRLPVESVEWHEINAALGQVALLLATLESITPLQFSMAILPMGSYSQLATYNASTGKVDDRSKRVNLYASDGGVLSFGTKSTFSKALEQLLQLVSEAGQYIQQQDPAFRLPYAVSGTKINNVAIAYNATQSEEHWTRALKFLLTDIKWIVAWAAKHTS